MTTTTTQLQQISLVCLTTADADRAIAFYVDALGFEKRTDVPFGDGYRWVEVYPPNGTAGIALAPPPEGRESEPRESGITITAADIDAAHAQLAGRGVDVDAEVMRMGDPVPPMFWFRDPDGHTLMVVQEA